MTAPSRPGLVVVGGSWGGLDAACDLLAALPAAVVHVPVVLVLHRARTSDSTVIDRVVRRASGHGILEVEDKEPLEPGKVLLAPPDYHLLVEPGMVSLSMEAPVNYSRPSIDLAFDTAADAYGPRAAAVLLSGVGHDGAAGMRRVKQAGGVTMVQAPESAEREEMPMSAIATGAVDVVAPPAALGAALAAMLEAGA